MGRVDIHSYDSVWLADFEFSSPPGERQKPICMVALNFFTGQVIRLWEDDLAILDSPPYPISKDAVFVAYYASAEMLCHLALGWGTPLNILDLFTEFRCITNGLYPQNGAGLIGAMSSYGLPVMEAAEKTAMRDLAIRGGPYTPEEREGLLDYCESDVRALEKLLPAMLPNIDLPRALLRGRYMAAVAGMEHAGIPIDTASLNILRDRWDDIQDHLIADVDKDYGVYNGRTFKRDRFEAYLVRNNIPWPRLPSGILDLQDDTFKDMARSYPAIAPLRELRYMRSKMRLSGLSVGSDGRNRCMLSAYRAKTGRNQPSTSKYIFGLSSWMRALIRPGPGYGVAYVDWSQQEFAIAAALSRDELMMDAYASGDPYMKFAIQAGLAPEGATKQTHKEQRTLCKECVLAVQYGMGAESLALRINRPVIEARDLLNLHTRTYKKYWEWSESVLNYAMLHGKIWTVYGWEIHVSERSKNPRSLCNFPMQANGAEMLRLACIFLMEAGIKVIAPVHDAVLIEAPLDRLDRDIARTRELMQKAGEIVLDGFQVRSDVDIVRYPDRYMDGRGIDMWDRVWKIIGDGGQGPSRL